VTRHVVEDQVVAQLALREVLLGVVDDMVRPERSDRVHVPRAAHAGHFRSEDLADYGPGVDWPEDRNTLHWLENRGTVAALEISVDVVRSE